MIRLYRLLQGLAVELYYLLIGVVLRQVLTGPVRGGTITVNTISPSTLLYTDRDLACDGD